jgi:hypothetical protein
MEIMLADKHNFTHDSLKGFQRYQEVKNVYRVHEGKMIEYKQRNLHRRNLKDFFFRLTGNLVDILKNSSAQCLILRRLYLHGMAIS